MRVVLQKVSRASVRVADEIVGRIGRGYMLLVGISQDDTPADIQWMVSKIVKLRVFEEGEAGGEGPHEGERPRLWHHTIQEVNGSILCVSQFTLHARTARGTRPDFHKAAGPQRARELYDEFRGLLATVLGGPSSRVQDGRFGAMMQCELTNEGPVTLILDSTERR